MNASRWIPLVALTAAVFVFVASAHSQPRAGAPASGPAASAPRMGMGPGGGMGMGGGGMRGQRMRAGADNTAGWSMMSPSEREAHRQKMMEMKSPDECMAYMDEHRKQMAERAKERGVAAPGRPRRDMCAGLK